MKKTLLGLAAALPLCGAMADEGMWTLYDLPQAVYEKMQIEGYQLPYDKLYKADDAIMKSVVNFSGYCSGVVVSPDGLVFTNHHCGFEAIRSHSTVEHDYMLNGFIAKSYEEELPNENMFVSFMVEQKDITDQVLTPRFQQMSMQAQAMYLDSLENALAKEVKAKDKTLRLELKPFYEGNRYYVTTYRDFTDLRLVFAIPKSMGKFGGETDNWMWPRQTCDFSVFRIYADPETNGPAAYSKRNVPYHPQHWAKVSTEGYREGDFSMTMGYPGSTSRYLSSYGISERYAQNATRAQVRGVKQQVMKRHMDLAEAVRIKYDSKYASSSNYWKNSIGMNKCIDSIGLIQQKEQFEQQLQRWLDSTGYLKGKLDLQLMRQLYQQRIAISEELMLWGESFSRNEELTQRAMRANTPGTRTEGSGKRAHINFKNNSDTWDYDTDREILGAMLQNYREQVKDQKWLPAFYTEVIDRKFHGDCQAYANHLYKKSALIKKGRIYPNKKSFRKDLGVSYGYELSQLRDALRNQLMGVSAEIEKQEQYLCDAKLRMEQDMPHYSDANFTMRMSYGQVKEYKLGGRPSGYYTDALSLLRKMQVADQQEDYRVEPEMMALMNEANTPAPGSSAQPYHDKRTGKLQLCFLTTNDITGGNSGSPMFDGQNRLIGLAFDGNWDSLSSDIFFDSQLARCIGVDIRFVLFMMDRWGHADRLLKEIKGE